MILGLSTPAFTGLHVLISLIGLVSGIAVVVGLLRGRFPTRVTAVFLAATIATSASGFLFHSKAIGPPHIVGAVSLVILALAVFALYGRGLAGAWRPAYVVSALAAFYLNVFVAIVQAFGKIPPLAALSPNPVAFLAVQGLALLGFAGLGVLGLRRPAAPSA